MQVTESSFSPWAALIASFGLMCVFAFFFARYAFQGLLRLAKRQERPLYRKWGVDEELFWPTSAPWFICVVIAGIFGSAVTYLIALFTAILVTDDIWLGANPYYDTFVAFSIAIVLGASVESQRFDDVQRKVNRLEGLRGIFHERFSASELLSVYESLQHSPTLFWEEYTQLPDEEVGEETNRKYRERAVPFRDSQSIKYNRITITVAALTFVVAVLLAGREFLS